MKQVNRTMAGWGNYPKESCLVYRPENIEALRELVVNKDTSSQIAYGLGRSYGDTALNEDAGVILFDKFDHLLAFNEETGILTCEAGVSLATIVDVFQPRGFFPGVTPGTKMITVGGAIANDVHGKNHHIDGCFSEFVIGFDLMIANGEIVACSREENADLFWATIGGIGLTGYILRATIRLVPIESSYIKATYEKAGNLEEAFEKFAVADQDYTYSVAWIDCLSTGESLGRSVLMRGEHAKRSELPANVRAPFKTGDGLKAMMPINAPSFALNYWTIKAFNATYYHSFKNETKIVDAGGFFHPLDAIEDWNKLYGKKGFVQYQAVFPKDQEPKAGIRKLLERLSEERTASFLAVLKSSGPAGEGLLSFPMEGYTLALDIPIKNNKLFDFLRELDQIVLDHGGRVYLAKDSEIDEATFKAMYPKWEEFMKIKHKIDPEGIFSSSMARRVGLV